MVRMPDTLMKLFSLSLVEGMENERGNWPMAAKRRSMPAPQHGADMEQRGLGVKRSRKRRDSKRLKVKQLLSCAEGRELLRAARRGACGAAGWPKLFDRKFIQQKWCEKAVIKDTAKIDIYFFCPNQQIAP